MGLPPPPSYDDATAETKPLTGDFKPPPGDFKPPPAGSEFQNNPPFVEHMQPSAPTATNITIEHVRPSTPQVPNLCSTGAPGYCAWCCIGFICPLPAAFFMGRRLGEGYAWLKYGIPGKLILNDRLG